MLRGVLPGIIAGAAGTVALDIATYADMAIRARSSSGAPSQLVSKVAEQIHLSLSSQGEGSQDQSAQNRESGLGALLGYINGLGIGALYGLLQGQDDNLPLPLGGVLLGAAAMAASDVPLIALRVSNPKTWGVSGWLSDGIPHLIYGLVTTATYKLLTEDGAC